MSIDTCMIHAQVTIKQEQTRIVREQKPNILLMINLVNSKVTIVHKLKTMTLDQRIFKHDKVPMYLAISMIYT